MGSSASTPSGGLPSIPNMSVGTNVDCFDPATKLWWPAEIIGFNGEGKKPYYVLVRCENEAERKIFFGQPKYNKIIHKKIAVLGTHTRESLTAKAAAEQLSSPSSSPSTSTPTTQPSASKSKRKKKKQSETKTRATNSSPPDREDEHDGAVGYDMSTLHKGDQCDALDIYKSSKSGKSTERWRPATVVKTLGYKVLVNFEGWSDDYNTWIDLEESSYRIAEYGQYSDDNKKAASTASTASTTPTTPTTYPSSKKTDNAVHLLRTRDECYGKDEYISKQTMELTFTWRPATVIDTSSSGVKLHFTDWHERWDAWFELDSGKIMTTSRYTQYQQELQELQGQQEQDPEYDLSNEPGSREEIRTSRESKKNRTNNNPNLQDIVPIRTTMPQTTGDGIVGLENLGNTCFMNSCLQCLLNTTPLAAYFLEDGHLRETNPKSSSGGRFAGAFGEFMQDYWSTRSHECAKAPRQLKKVIGKFARQFSGFAQHDAQEVSCCGSCASFVARPCNERTLLTDYLLPTFRLTFSFSPLFSAVAVSVGRTS